ncbi:hypothetical protein HZA99_00840 [Candidatus Woesearchaeota archaeon]|nr:hypothetical protein [Candidatus Woesearchaeota archaeon]
MNKILAAQIKKDMQTISLQRMQYPSIHLQPFSQAYIPLELTKENFTKIIPKQTDKTMIFIDGGNAEILKTPDYSIQFLRFAAVGFQKNKKIFQKKREGYLLVFPKKMESTIYYTTKGYGELADFPELILSPKELPQKNGTSITKLSTAGDLFRSLYEIHFAAKQLEHDEIIVLDRALLPENGFEEEAFTELGEHAANKNAIVCGLNKTTTLLCNTGESIATHLHSFQQKGSWLYQNVFATHDIKHNATTNFVKLHPKAKYIFRFEIAAQNKQSTEDVVSFLASLSNDAAFIGYPYGLIVADQFARVSNREKELLQTLFFQYVGTDFATHTVDAHNILDTMGERRKT